MRENKSYYAILGLLSIGPQSGYDLKRTIEQSLGHFWTESFGQIYPVLKKLVDEGLAAVSSEPQTGKRDRIAYSITEAGREMLHDWLLKPITKLPPEKNELLLKLYFGHNLNVEDNLRHVEDFYAKLLQTRDIYTMISREAGPSPHPHRPDYEIMTLQFGQKVVEAIIEWCEETRAELLTYIEKD